MKVSFADDAGSEENAHQRANDRCTRDDLSTARSYRYRQRKPASLSRGRSQTTTQGRTITSCATDRRTESRKPLVYVDFTDTGDTNFTDTDVSPGILYVYQVRAPITIFGDLGEPSLPAQIRMPGAAADRNTLPVGLPTINGTAQVGETLTADTSGISDEDGLEEATFGYQWLADAALINGATHSSYTLADADEGRVIKVEVSFTDDAGNDENIDQRCDRSGGGEAQHPGHWRADYQRHGAGGERR